MKNPIINDDPEKWELCRRAAYMENEEGDYYFADPDNVVSDMFENWSTKEIMAEVEKAEKQGYQYA